MSRTIKIAAVQMRVTPAPMAQRLERAEKIIAEAARQGAQLAVLPELFNTGYEYSDENYSRAEPLSGPTITWMKRAAAQYNVHLAGSLLLLDVEDIYNALLLVAPDGQTWRYDKNYPWVWERAYFRDGHGIAVADTGLGRLGLMICMDQGRAELWARYAGQVDAMVISSCPPRMHDITWTLADGRQVKSRELGGVMENIYRAGDEIFGDYLRRQAAWLGVPVVNTTATGKFVSAIPMPQVSWAIYMAARPDLWRHIPQAKTVRIEADLFNETYVADAAGRVLAQTPPEVEGCAIAEIALADSTPQPRGPQPAFGLPAIAYQLDDLANVLLSSFYRRKVRQFHGAHMAPVTRSTRLWLGGLAAAGLLGFALGRNARRKH